MIREVPALALCGLVLVVAGCGSSSANSTSGTVSNTAYKTAVTKAATPWTAAAQHFSTAAQSANVSEDVAAIGAFTAANAAFANLLATVKAPAGAQTAHAAVIASLRNLGTQLTNLQHAAQHALKTHTTGGLKSAQVAVVTALQGVRSTTQALQAKVS
jgi:hypothetical protein